MNLRLVNKDFLSDGIFGLLYDDQNNVICHTLQHAYDNNSGTYMPKLPTGVYICVRGMHRLENMTEPFQTFEITNVPKHTNILFHIGNYNKDSEGCVLLGLDEVETNGYHMLISSHVAFEEFMKLQENVDSFILTVE